MYDDAAAAPYHSPGGGAPADRGGPRATGYLWSVLARWGIRIGMGLAGVAAGLLVSRAVLGGLTISLTALVETTVIFWLLHLAVQFLALRVLIRQPSVALAGLLAIASTVVSLVIVNFVVPGLHVHGASTYLFATLIIWATTALADVIGQRMIRARRMDRREERRGR
jgi:hypothetical protein